VCVTIGLKKEYCRTKKTLKSYHCSAPNVIVEATTCQLEEEARAKRAQWEERGLAWEEGSDGEAAGAALRWATRILACVLCNYQWMDRQACNAEDRLIDMLW
jgi:hypothetical protein